MANLVVTGALMQCSGQFVPAPIPFTASQAHLVGGMKMAAGNVSDVSPGMCVPPSFGACKLDANPAVASAKAGGSPSAPCVFAPMGIWTGGSTTVMIQNQPALTDACKLRCATAAGAGEISFVNTPAATISVG